jgi:hypothetical protein
MSRITKRIFATLALSLLAVAFTGCGSGNREGRSGIEGSALFGGVATVGDSTCRQCHSSVREALTQEFIIDQYQLSSPHNVSGLGCESCHGGGAGHNGVGPIPFALVGFTPAEKAARCATCHDGVQTLTVNGVATVAPASNATDFAASNHANMRLFTNGLCIRCHTSEGGIVSNTTGFTGGSAVLDNPAFGPPVVTTAFTAINCETCHQHGGALRSVQTTDTVSGTVVRWDPNANGRIDQYDLCTSCHTLTNNAGTLLVDGSTLTGGVVTESVVGRHADEWYRFIASTHYDNPNTGVGLATNVVEGYVVRSSSATACYDCHGHEAKTETNPGSTGLTIHKDWAQSAHAGRVLAAKYTATAGLADAATTVALAMNAGAIDDADLGGPGWVHYNWDDTASRGSCQACHTSTGISNYLIQQTPDLTGYDATGANNRFTHLSGWSATGGSPQNELLYCWGCHSNAGTGALRNTSQAILTFTDPNNNPIVITNAGNSSACIVCHGGRGSAGEAILTPSSRFNGHHAPTAGFLYSEQTHIGFEYPGQSYANPAFFAHDEIGANAAGPCASCHMGPSASDGKPSHSFAALTESGGVITAINNQALCNTCHTPGGSFEITPAVMEEERNGFHQASTILNNYLQNVTGYTNYLNANIITTFATAPENAYRAYQNGKIGGTLGGTFGATVITARAGEEPCAYVHNRFYIKRLVFDSIDWMLDGAINNTITLSAQTIIDYPEAVAWLGADPTTGVATRP